MGDHTHRVMLSLYGDQVERLRDALVGRFENEKRFGEFLLYKLNENFDLLTSPNHEYPARVRMVITRAQAAHWLHHLIVKASEEHPPDPTLGRFRTEVQVNVAPVAADPFESCCLSGDYVLVNRRQLRNALRRLLEPLGKRILVVRDPPRPTAMPPPPTLPRTGKSHSLQMITYLSQRRGDFEVRRIDLKALSAALGREVPITPLDLGAKILGALQRPDLLPEPPQDAQWARWVSEFGNELELKLMQKSGEPVRWLVIDSFNHVPLLQPTLGLIKDLALRINDTLSSLRLVLLGWEETLPTDVAAHLEQEELQPISMPELIAFFKQALEERQHTVTPSMVAESVRLVVQEARTKKSDLIVVLGEVAGSVLRNPPGPPTPGPTSPSDASSSSLNRLD